MSTANTLTISALVNNELSLESILETSRYGESSLNDISNLLRIQSGNLITPITPELMLSICKVLERQLNLGLLEILPAVLRCLRKTGWRLLSREEKLKAVDRTTVDLAALADGTSSLDRNCKCEQRRLRLRWIRHLDYPYVVSSYPARNGSEETACALSQTTVERSNKAIEPCAAYKDVSKNRIKGITKTPRMKKHTTERTADLQDSENVNMSKNPALESRYRSQRGNLTSAMPLQANSIRCVQSKYVSARKVNVSSLSSNNLKSKPSTIAKFPVLSIAVSPKNPRLASSSLSNTRRTSKDQAKVSNPTFSAVTASARARIVTRAAIKKTPYVPTSAVAINHTPVPKRTKKLSAIKATRTDLAVQADCVAPVSSNNMVLRPRRN